ncbi:MAG: LytS/YhcK type 5TM receptor domain-containing protein [Methanosphaera sp.]|nr:LytS/YhcK type 5TM receptor domain-containing protein [Methanosphaera sp.]
MIKMLKKKYNINPNYLKMNIVYLILIISNIVLFIGLIDYNIKSGVNINLESWDYFSTVIPTIIVLGFITTRLTKLRERESSLYEIGSLIMITIISLMASYFSDKSNTAALFGPYLEMFRALSVILIFILMATLLKPFKEILHGRYDKRNLLICFVIFALLGLYATRFHIDVDGTPANVRCMVVMISGLFGGPFVGIPVGIISGAFRYSMGGPTGLPCTVSTVLSGVVGSLIFKWNDRKFPQPITAIILMFLYTGFEMMLVILLTPQDISYPLIQNIYPEMLFASVIGVVLFSLVIRDQREKINSPSAYEEIRKDLEDELNSDDEITELKKEIEWMKNEIKELKKG